jgi:amidase
VAIPEYDKLDALGLVELVRKRQVSRAELLEAAIERAERINPKINAIITPLYEQARQEISATSNHETARLLPFAGLPLLIKDLDAAVAGAVTSYGSRFLAGYRPTHDAEIVKRFRRAGAVIFGKTNTPELGITPYTEPESFGPSRNPWDLTRTPGGSSGGAAAAVAAGIVPIAHASDGGGSIRIPASCCGLFGLKPTRGRTPVGPDASQLWSGLAIGGVISRSVRDSAAMLDAIAGPELTSPYWAPPQIRPFLEEVGGPPGQLRIALTKRPHLTTVAPHADCLAAVDDAARLLANLGHHVEPADLDIDGDELARDFFLIVCVEVAALIVRAEKAVGRRARHKDFQTSTMLTATIGRQQSALAMTLARERMDAVARKVAAFHERFDMVLSPTLGLPPPAIGALHPQGAEARLQEVLVKFKLGFLLRLPGVVDQSVRRVFSFIPFTPLENVTGQPAMSVPLYWNASGLPIGVQLAARFGDEATLFRVASQLEAARSWSDQRPPRIDAAPPVAPRPAVPAAPAVDAPRR